MGHDPVEGRRRRMDRWFADLGPPIHEHLAAIGDDTYAATEPLAR
jgi:hypothetical protein